MHDWGWQSGGREVSEAQRRENGTEACSMEVLQSLDRTVAPGGPQRGMEVGRGGVWRWTHSHTDVSTNTLAFFCMEWIFFRMICDGDLCRSRNPDYSHNPKAHQSLEKSTFSDGLQLAGALRVGAVERLWLAQALQRQEGVVVRVEEVRQLQWVILGAVEGLRPVHTTMQNLVEGRRRSH